MGNFTNWVKTDDGQWVKQVNENQFWIAEIRVCQDEYGASINFIDLETYDQEDILETLETYGYHEGDYISNQIIAECLAESIMDFCCVYKGTYEDCEAWILEHIREDI